jgi:hypothetical protein
MATAGWLAVLGLLPLFGGAAAGETPRLVFAHLTDCQFGVTEYDADLARYRRAVALVNELAGPEDLRFMIMTGDMADVPGDQVNQDFLDASAALLIPWHVVPGNHDFPDAKPETLERYRRYFGPDYYEVDYGAYRLLVVNTNLWKKKRDRTAGQDAWFRAALARARDEGAIILVAGHHPLFLKTPNEPEQYHNLPGARRMELLALFKEYGVAAYLGGHAHARIDHFLEGTRFLHAETTSYNADRRPHGFRMVVLDGRAATDYFIPLDNEDIAGLLRLQRAFVDATPVSGLEIAWLPREERVCRLEGKAFDLSWPFYDRFASATAKAGSDGYLFTVTNTDAAQPVYFTIRLPDDVAPDRAFFLFDPIRKELHTRPDGDADGAPADRWRKADLAKFISVCPAARETLLRVSVDEPEHCTRVPAIVSVPPYPDAVLEARAVDVAPKVDGDLSDPAWREATAHAFVDIRGNELAEPATVRMVADRDRTTLYLAFTVPDAEIVTRTTERDGPVWEDDSVEIYLASSDQRNFFQIVVNAAGVVFDKDALSGAEWTADMVHACRRDEAAGVWFLEVALPLGPFGLTGALEGNFCRTDQPGGRLSNLSPTGGNFHQRASFRPIDLID